MKIYVGYSNEWKYRKEILEPIYKSKLYKENDFVFPNISDNINMQECDLIILDEYYDTKKTRQGCR